MVLARRFQRRGGAWGHHFPSTNPRSPGIGARPLGDLARDAAKPPPKAGPQPIAPRRMAEVTCWCERRTFRLPLVFVRAGWTTSCGRPHCRSP